VIRRREHVEVGSLQEVSPTVERRHRGASRQRCERFESLGGQAGYGSGCGWSRIVRKNQGPPGRGEREDGERSCHREQGHFLRVEPGSQTRDRVDSPPPRASGVTLAKARQLPKAGRDSGERQEGQAGHAKARNIATSGAGDNHHRQAEHRWNRDSQREHRRGVKNGKKGLRFDHVIEPNRPDERIDAGKRTAQEGGAGHRRDRHRKQDRGAASPERGGKAARPAGERDRPRRADQARDEMADTERICRPRQSSVPAERLRKKSPINPKPRPMPNHPSEPASSVPRQIHASTIAAHNVTSSGAVSRLMASERATTCAGDRRLAGAARIETGQGRRPPRRRGPQVAGA